MNFSFSCRLVLFFFSLFLIVGVVHSPNFHRSVATTRFDKPKTSGTLSVKTPVTCLASAIWHEARGESMLGQLAVATTIMNRQKSKQFPNDICSIVFQPFQFSGLRVIRYDKSTLRLAKKILSGEIKLLAMTATHYHNLTVFPQWAEKMNVVASIGNHIFYSARKGV